MQAVKQRTWEDCVVEAKGEVRNIKRSRLKIAQLAIEACDIKFGNRDRAREGSTLRAFAEAIGMSEMNLGTLVNAYKRGLEKGTISKENPTEQQFKVARKEYKDRPKAEKERGWSRRAPGVQAANRANVLLRETQKSIKFFEDVPKEIKSIDQGVKNELIIKLNRIINILLKNG